MREYKTWNVSPAPYASLISRYFLSQRAKVLLLSILLFSSIGLQILNPQILRHFIDTAIAGGTPRILMNIALLFLGVAVFKQLGRVATAYVNENIGWTATNQVRSDLAFHCLNLDMPFHTAHTPGEMIERIDGDVDNLTNFFSQFTIQLVGNLLLVIGILGALFWEDWRVSVGLALYTLITLLFLSRLWGISVPYMKALRETDARLSGFLEERLAGTEDIGANGGWDYVIKRMYQLLRDRLHHGRRANVSGAFVIGAANILFMLCNTIGLGLGAYLYLSGSVTIGTVFLIFQYTNLLFQPLKQITLQVDDLQKASASIQRIQALFETQSSLRESSVSEATNPLQYKPPQVSFQAVSFAYVTGKFVLHDLSFCIQPKQTLGLLGRTGSGKSSIARLLVRLYDPTSGTIQLNDIDIQQLQLAMLRQHIGLVTQEVQLFHATVRDNLTFYAPHITDEQIIEVFYELGLSDWYETLPASLNTQLNPNELSAGEAQLLAFARIFLRDPGLVILDEVSSRLDPASEQRLERALDKLLQERTSIIIAHRLSTIQRADHIIILDNGQIIEQGERHTLAASSTSYFSRLLQTGLTLTEAAEVVLP